MDVLPIPPTPPTAVVLPGPVPPPPAPSGAGWQDGILKRIRNVLLLPLRVVQRVVLDCQNAMMHLFMAFWELVLAALALGFTVLIYLVESILENLFIGEVFEILFPPMRAYLPDASAIGIFLALVFPALDEVEASTIFAFVVASGAVLATSVFFMSLKRWQLSRGQAPFQEALLLDPRAQETPPAPPNPRRPASLALVGMWVGAATQLPLFSFEIFAFPQVLGSALLGVLSALLLVGVRLMFGYVAHFGLESLIVHARAAGDHVVGFGTSVLAIVPNMITEFNHRLETLGSA